MYEDHWREYTLVMFIPIDYIILNSEAEYQMKGTGCNFLLKWWHFILDECILCVTRDLSNWNMYQRWLAYTRHNWLPACPIYNLSAQASNSFDAWGSSPSLPIDSARKKYQFGPCRFPANCRYFQPNSLISKHWPIFKHGSVKWVDNKWKGRGL